MKKYEQKIVDRVRMPPSDVSCELEEGTGFNIGYERGHGQAKVDARTVARQADLEIEALIDEVESAHAEIARLKCKKFAYFADQDCWIYQGDDDDQLESLVCPVVISAQDLLKLKANQLTTEGNKNKSKTK